MLLYCIQLRLNKLMTWHMPSENVSSSLCLYLCDCLSVRPAAWVCFAWLDTSVSVFTWLRGWHLGGGGVVGERERACMCKLLPAQGVTETIRPCPSDQQERGEEQSNRRAAIIYHWRQKRMLTSACAHSKEQRRRKREGAKAQMKSEDGHRTMKIYT